MKRLLFLVFVCHVCITNVFAQDCGLCGTWIGIAHDTTLKEHPETGNVMPADEKLYVRIKQINGNYQVRMKAQIADGSRPFSYLPECRVTSVDGNTIKWSQDWGGNDDSNQSTMQGVVVGRDTQIAYFTGILMDGVLRLSEIYIITYYDRQGRIITSKSFPVHYSNGVTLYKEDDDW